MDFVPGALFQKRRYLLNRSEKAVVSRGDSNFQHGLEPGDVFTSVLKTRTRQRTSCHAGLTVCLLALDALRGRPDVVVSLAEATSWMTFSATDRGAGPPMQRWRSSSPCVRGGPQTA